MNQYFQRQRFFKKTFPMFLMTVAVIAGFIFTTLPFRRTGAQAAVEKTVQQTFFYDKGNSTTTSIAQNAGLVILPRGKSSLRNELRSAGYQGKAVQYFLANQVAGPGPYANSSASCNTSFAPYVLNHVAFQKGDFCTYIHPNESWFLHNGRGERLYSSHPDGVTYHMNPASSGWRAFALKRMTRDLFGDSTQAKLGWDGIFLDNLHLKIYNLQKQKRNSDGVVKEFADSIAYRAAVRGYIAQLSDAIRPHGPVLWANLTDDWEVSIENQMSYLQYLDGGMNEAWALGYKGIPLNATQWNTVLTLAETAQASGKGLLAVVQGNQTDTTRQQFGLASYLLIAKSGPTYFRYADAAAYGSWWQYENYKVALGAPQGKRYQVGSSWRRDFACGYVEADPTARTGKIVQRTCSTGAVVPSGVTLPSNIQAEDYKAGGSNVGYSDTTSGNNGAVYRSDDVDVQACSSCTNSYNVGWVAAGEWLAYDVNVGTSSNYNLRVRVATPNSAKSFHIQVDGAKVTGSIPVPTTGSWTAWNVVTATIPLTAGNRTIRLVAETGGFNLDSIDISQASSTNAGITASAPVEGEAPAPADQVVTEPADAGVTEPSNETVTEPATDAPAAVPENAPATDPATGPPADLPAAAPENVPAADPATGPPADLPAAAPENVPAADPAKGPPADLPAAAPENVPAADPAKGPPADLPAAAGNAMPTPPAP